MSAAEGLGEVAAVIAAHGYDAGWRCSCGWTGTSDEYDTHLAEALVPLIAERERRAAEAAERKVERVEALIADDIGREGRHWQWVDADHFDPDAKLGTISRAVRVSDLRAALTEEATCSE